MDKDKSQQLKEILNKTISKEEIEEKLKEEIKKSSMKKNQNKSDINNEDNKSKPSEDGIVTPKKEKVEKESPINDKVNIPTIKDKKTQNNNINKYIYFTSFVAIFLFVFVIYLFTSKNILDIQKNEILQENIVADNLNDKDNLKNVVNDINLNINYPSTNNTKDISLNTNNIIENDKLTNENSINNKTKEENKVKKIIKEVIKEKIVTKIVPLNKENFKTFYNSQKFKTLKCYDFKAGDVFPTKSCKANLSTFLQNNNEAIRFEIIPVLAEDDNIIFNKLKSDIKSHENLFKQRVEEYLYRGLSRERVLETSWYVKNALGEDIVLTPTNYYVKSKKNNKGIIIKAYY